MAGPNPATTEWVPVWSPVISGPSGPTGATGPQGPQGIPGTGGGGAPDAHATTHLPAGADPIPNAAYKNIDNQFTKQTIIDPIHALRLDGSSHAGLIWNTTSEPVDKRKWRVINYQQNLRFDCINDAENANLDAVITFGRTGHIGTPGQINAAGLGTTPVADANLSANVALKNINNLFSAAQTLPSTSEIRGQYSWLNFFDTVGPADAQWWRMLSYNNGLFYLEALNAGGGVIRQYVFGRDGSFSISGPLNCYYVEATAHIRAAAGLYAGSGLYEQGRTTPAGHWIDVPQVDSNFQTNVGDTWAPGVQAWNRYTLIGKTMIWSCKQDAGSVSGSPTALWAFVPGGYTVIAGGGATSQLYVAGLGNIPGNVRAAPGNVLVEILKYDDSVIASGILYVQFTVCLSLA